MVAFWNRNDFATNIVFDPGLEREPVQRAVQIAPFETEFNDVTYRVEPEYDYDLYGMVVSYQHHDGDSMLHKAWNDHLNMADVCVVWQDTAFSPLLNRLDFWNGQFTCNVKTNDNAAWAQFRMDQLSNNHLISDDLAIRKQISDIKIGDQIRVQGWLSAYSSSAQSNKGGGKRGTSTVRTDTGNGACETIFVREFDIIEAASGGWRKLMYLSSSIYLAALTVYFWLPYRPYGRR
ncbi:MAG: hypothetical protein DRR06_19305 [Gammaproteobacteria bacterium]|nr:MAG: hypothetical protein DRR06_19305 [Gammaproteobacteria bacterium]